VLRALLSIVLVFATSACDLSCWLHQTDFHCHSASSATENNQSTCAWSEMDMSSEAEMSSHGIECHAGSDCGAKAGTHHHSIFAQMDTIRHSLQVIQKSDVSAMFDHSKRLSRCSHATCSQASAAAFALSASRSQSDSVYCAAIHVSGPEDFLTTPRPTAPGTSPHITLAIDPLITLRI
jgi:hypothetical protein